MGMSVRQLEEEVVRRIEALNPAGTDSIGAYVQGTSQARWTPIRREGATPTAPAEIVHLSFTVFVESSPRVDGSRGRPGDWETVRSRLNVLFLYYLREQDAVADRRLAYDAANDLVRAINAFPHDQYQPELVDAGRVQVTDGPRPALVVTVVFDINHEIEV